MVYLAGGLFKASGEQWWDGDAIWRAVMLPEYRQLDFTWLADHAWFAKVSGWWVVAVETGYAIFIWPRRTRRPWIVATVLMHLGIGLFMGLGVFAAIMIAFTVAAFGVNAEPAPGELVPGPTS
jgi:hypothetical protein